MTNLAPQAFKPLDPKKFRDPDVTATSARRASVAFQALETLWFNTGTLCNLTCETCYIESSPKNDRLVYLTNEEVVRFLDEIATNGWTTEEIGFTGGEPFMNPHMMPMLEAALSRGFRVLVLTKRHAPHDEVDARSARSERAIWPKACAADLARSLHRKAARDGTRS